MVSIESSADANDDACPLISKSKNLRRPMPVASKENNVVLELSSDEDDEIYDDLKTRLGKKFKNDTTEVIEID